MHTRIPKRSPQPHRTLSLHIPKPPTIRTYTRSALSLPQMDPKLQAWHPDAWRLLKYLGRALARMWRMEPIHVES